MLAGGTVLLRPPPAVALPGYLLLWSGMVAALMAPTMVQLLDLYDGVLGERGAVSRARAHALVLAPYMALWVVCGAATWLLLSLVEGRPLAQATLVAAASAHQLSPLARGCLSRCRSPIGLLMSVGSRAPSPVGALEVGSRYALSCLGCCAGIWIGLVAAGAMGLSWMTALALLVFIEKFHPQGETFARASGVVLLALVLPVAIGLEVWTEIAGVLAFVLLAVMAAVTSWRREASSSASAHLPGPHPPQPATQKTQGGGRCTSRSSTSG